MGLRNDERPVCTSAMWLVGIALLSLGAWAVFMRPVAPLDFNVFVSAGRAVAGGVDPYPRLGSPGVWSGSAFVYPWVTAWLFVPAAAASHQVAVVVMAAFSIGCVIGGVWVVLGRQLVPVMWVLLASPTIVGLQMGTVNAALFLGVCVAWRWRDHPVRTGVAVGMLITLKILCWPLVIWLLLTRRWRAAGSAIGLTALLLSVSWTAGSFGPLSYGQLLRELADHEVAWSAGLQGLLVLWSTPVIAAEVIGLVAVAGIVVVVTRRSDVLIYTGMIAAALFASPVVWHHYYLLAAAPVLLLRDGPRWYFLIGWASVAPHMSYGLSWHPVTVAADVALTACCLALAWRKRATLSTRCRRVMPVTWTMWTVVAACLATAVVRTTDRDVLLQCLSQAVVPVGATVALLVAAMVQDARRDQGEVGDEPAAGGRGLGPHTALVGVSRAGFASMRDA